MKYYIIITVILVGLAYSFGRYMQPAKTITQEKQVEVVKHDVRTIYKTITRPDGTKEVIKIDEDLTQTKKKNESIKITDNTKPGFHLQGFAKLNNIVQPVYGLGVEKRVLGPIFLGVWGNTDKEYGVSLGLEF